MVDSGTSRGRRIDSHPVLPESVHGELLDFEFDGQPITAREGDTVASALWAAGIRVFRTTPETKEPRGYFCGVGRCSDCAVRVDGEINVRACVTRVKKGMVVRSQDGLGNWDGSAR